MIDNSSNSKIAKNTIFLYIRMLVVVLVMLYTSRVVLRVLGISDFGLYNVIGGLLTMFSMFSIALSVGTQRFLTFAIGEGDELKLRQTFSTALTLHFSLSAIILFFAETFGLWVLNTYVNIPAGREDAAFWVYQFTIAAFVLNLIQIPFQSAIIAHEKMGIYAFMGVYDASMKLLIALLLTTVEYDKLKLYGALMFLVNFSSLLIYNFYSRRTFEECRFRFLWNKDIVKEMAKYSGWSVIGGSLGFFTDQGLNLLLNIFSGTYVNAARAIANQMNSIIQNFVNNYQVAVNPQLIKRFARKEFESLYKLVVDNARIVAYLFLFFSVPLFIEIRFVLKIWLVEYPEYAPVFLRFVLVQTLVNAIHQPLAIAIQASGKIKLPSLFSLILILIFPISYFLLKAGFPPYSIYIVSIIMWTIVALSNLFFARAYAGIPISLILKKVYFNIIPGTILIFSVPYLVSTRMDVGLIRFLLVGTVSVIASLSVFYFWGLSSEMRKSVNMKIMKIFKRIF